MAVRGTPSPPENALPAAQWTNVHLPALDGVRAAAILLVIPHNVDVFNNVGGLLWPVAMFAHVGWIGVQLFFVLSGFLITGNLLDSQRADNYYGAFFARRVLRIFPLYYGVLLAGLYLVPLFHEYSPTALSSHAHQVWYWTFLSNWTEPFGKEVHGFSHFWSLAVEEQFYLLWPFVVHRLAPKRVIALSIALIFIALAIRTAMLMHDANWESVYMFTFCRMDSLAFGAAMAALIRLPQWHEVLIRRRTQLFVASVLLAVVGALYSHQYDAMDSGTQTLGYFALNIFFGVLILTCAVDHADRRMGWLQRSLSLRPLRSVGKYSYGMYVLHLPIALALGYTSFRRFGSAAPVLYTVAVLLLSYCAAAVSFHCFEKHFLKLKHRFVPNVPAVAVRT